jgi:hypothetical protein
MHGSMPANVSLRARLGANRWREVPSVADANYTDIGDWLFETAREAGHTPSVFHYKLASAPRGYTRALFRQPGP